MGTALQHAIAAAFQAAETQRQISLDAMKRAESLLAAALGLNDWAVPEPLTYERRRENVVQAGRLDAQFFTPRNLSLMALLGKDGLLIKDVAELRGEKFSALSDGTFRYLEIGGVRTDGSVGFVEVQHSDAPSRASQLVRKGDVITSTVRPIRRLSAMIEPDQDGDVCSSGFVVLVPKSVRSAVLLVYLRLRSLSC